MKNFSPVSVSLAVYLLLLVGVISYGYRISSNENIVFRCGNARDVISKRVAFQNAGMTIECPENTHVTAEEQVLNNVKSLRIICECNQ